MAEPAIDGDLIQVLGTDGSVLDGATVPDLDDGTLIEMYRQMRLLRHFDERAVNLQRQGRLGTYPPSAGQEAAQIASTHALSPDDWVIYQYREHGAVVARGFGPEYLLYWMGHEDGNEWLADRHIFPINIGIASQIPHATGMAWASKLAGEDAVFICHFGDGATSEGDFHEGLNFGGVFDVPCVYFCNNNQWAISVPRDRQTASETIAQKATAYGFEGVLVDGMDPLAVYAVTEEAVETARGDAGRPTLVEAVQYRFGAHTTADDPSTYRTESEVEAWRARDPIPRLEAFLRDRDLLDDDRVAVIEGDVRDTVAEVIERAERSAARDPDRMFEHVYEGLPPALAAQRDELRDLRDRRGDDALLEGE